MDRSRAVQHGSPTVIRTARMSAPEGISFSEGFTASRARPGTYAVRSSSPMPPLARRGAGGPGRRRIPQFSFGDSSSDEDMPLLEASAGVSAAARARTHAALDAIAQARAERATIAQARAERATAATESSPAVARRSTRKRRAPEMLEPSPDSRPRKRAAPEPAPQKPPPQKPPAKKKRAPGRLKTDPDEEETPCDSNCCICMTEPEAEELATINGCEHYFCFGCIEKWADRENTCPLCKKRFVTIERVHKPKRKKGTRTPKSTVKVKNKSQRSELTSSMALDSLFGELAGRTGGGIAFEHFFARLGSSRFNTQIARIVVGGMGIAEGPGSAAASASARSDAASAGGAATRSRARTAYAARSSPDAGSSSGPSSFRYARGFADAMLRDDDDSDDDDDDGFSGFVNSIRRMDATRGAGATFSFSSMPAMHMSPPPPPPRSYATNMNDASAGGSAETPLEIEDSDDDDEEVQILGTSRASSRPPAARFARSARGM